MKQLSHFDLHFLINEFQETLKDQRIDTFYIDNDILYLKVYVKSKGNFFLVNKISKFIYLDTNKKTNSNIVPKSFTLALRKYLKNGYIRDIKQIQNERIIIITVEKKENEEIKKFNLIIELFLNGNIVITDENDKIINLYLRRNFKDRTLKIGETYQIPENNKINIFNLDDNFFKEKLNKSNLEIVKFIAIEFGIGGKYAEEICFRAKIDKKKECSKLENKEIEEILDSINSFLNENEKNISYFNNEKIVEFSPLKLKIFKEKYKEKKYPNYNEVIKEYFSQFLETENENKKYSEFENNIRKKEKIIEKQKKLKDNIIKEIDILNKKGNLIYENYSLIEELLNSINKTAKEKGWDYVLKKIENEPKLKSIIKKINPAKNEIILDLKEN
jgi:predicted ribosome quality control (RQC) complex YloA/Tae2 family protein